MIATFVIALIALSIVLVLSASEIFANGIKFDSTTITILIPGWIVLMAPIFYSMTNKDKEPNANSR